MAAPSMKRRFAVECQDPTDKSRWWAIGSYDTEAEATAHAKDPSIKENTRVRQFYQQWENDYAIAPDFYKPPAPASVDAEELVSYKCGDHPGYTVRATPGGQPPRCPSCRRVMLPASMVDALNGPIEVLK